MTSSRKYSAGGSSNENDILQARPAGPRRRRVMSASVLAKAYGRVLRAVFCVAALGMAAGGALVFEAAYSTNTALAAAHSALAQDEGPARTSALLLAANSIESNWARPGGWHAGAQEAVSWTYAALAAQMPENTDFRDRAVLNAERTLSRAPIQPAPWARLAAYDLAGQRNGLCDAEDCLAYSWRAQEMAPLATYCARLQMGHQLGLVGGAEDPRLLALTRVPVTPEALRACMDYLPADAVYQVLLVQQWQSAERLRRAHEAGISPYTRPYE
ncbi:hypothetical protein [Vitreimonas flagellata]|uniref:hypothetical protein n=1 Tax=Vitreimonas flagellata TaxID=2560861 RepID=UPI001074F413|nr:hypothetical protein [Vitreimonas flagellata]